MALSNTYKGEKTMTDTITQMLGIMGLDKAPPETLAELIPYLLHVAVGIGLLVAIFGMFRAIVMSIINGKPRM